MSSLENQEICFAWTNVTSSTVEIGIVGHVFFFSLLNVFVSLNSENRKFTGCKDNQNIVETVSQVSHEISKNKEFLNVHFQPCTNLRHFYIYILLFTFVTLFICNITRLIVVFKNLFWFSIKTNMCLDYDYPYKT